MDSFVTPHVFRFVDRRVAGRELARRVRPLVTARRGEDWIVLALPRGGVPVGFEVAKAIGAPLDVFVVRKLGVPQDEEVAMGAIASGGVRVLDHGTIALLDLSSTVVDSITMRELAELRRREELYRRGLPPLSIEGRCTILVDDGVATGATMQAAVESLRLREPARIVVAVPIGVFVVCESLRSLVDEVVCARTPEPFLGVGRWYEDFRPVSDEEVVDLLERARSGTPSQPVHSERIDVP
jgi:predicted phosphoribosyltransferase